MTGEIYSRFSWPPRMAHARGLARRAHRRPPLSGASHAPQSASRSMLRISLAASWNTFGNLAECALREAREKCVDVSIEGLLALPPSLVPQEASIGFPQRWGRASLEAAQDCEPRKTREVRLVSARSTPPEISPLPPACHRRYARGSLPAAYTTLR